MRSIEAHSYGCVMAMLDGDVKERLIHYAMAIPEEDLFTDGSGEHGAETEPHITVKYGVHTDDPDEVAKALAGQATAGATLRGLSVFENEDFNVLKVDIDSKCLARLNKAIYDGLETTDTHPVYHPHATVAYLKKDVDYKKYFTKMFDGVAVEFTRLRWSPANGKKTWIPLSEGTAMAARDMLRLARDLIANGQ